jgi:hypothetical protein
MILARLPSSDKGTVIPPDWTEGLSRLLNEAYSKECKQKGRYFDVWGQIFDEELLVIVSYLSEKNEADSPIAVFLSCSPEQMSDEKKVKETQANYMDLAGLFYDEVFSQDEFMEFEPNWQEVTHNQQNYFYKISRENINLTLDANALLGDDFEEI